MERQRLQQNSQRAKLKMKQDVAIDSISDRHQCRTINLQINAKSSSSTPPHSPPPPVLPPNVSGNVDRGLYDDLVEIVPLIETLMVRFVFINLFSIFLYIHPITVLLIFFFYRIKEGTRRTNVLRE